MIQMLIIAACIIVHMGDHAAFHATDPRIFLAYIVVLLAMASGVQFLCWRSRLRMDRIGWGYARYAADRAIFATRVASVVVHAVAVLGLGLLDWIRANVGDFILLDEAICVLPVVLFFAAGWWSIYPIERRVREAMLYRELHEAATVAPLRGRVAFVWSRVREGMGIVLIPIALATASLESLDRFGAPLVAQWTEHTALADSVSTVLALASAMVVLMVLALAPALVRFAWDLVPLPEGRTHASIASVLARRRIRVVGPLVWRTGGDSVNAAVLGAIFPFRYMVFTDALLAHLPLRQLQAVTAHEIAHIRLHHMPWMMVCVLASVYFLSLLAALIGWGLGIPVGSEAASMWLSLAILVPVAWLFGIVSRRMEWQADAFAACVLSELESSQPSPAGDDSMEPSPVRSAEPSHEQSVRAIGPEQASDATPQTDSTIDPMPRDRSPRITSEAAAAVASALQTVADLNAMNPAARSFRHGSIRTRQRNVMSLVGVEADAIPIDRTVRRIKAIAVGAMLLSAAIHFGSTYL